MIKYGLFPNTSLSTFLFIIAGTGMAIYTACAIIFTMKAKAAKEELSLAKGIILKQSI